MFHCFQDIEVYKIENLRGFNCLKTGKGVTLPKIIMPRTLTFGVNPCRGRKHERFFHLPYPYKKESITIMAKVNGENESQEELLEEQLWKAALIKAIAENLAKVKV